MRRCGPVRERGGVEEEGKLVFLIMGKVPTKNHKDAGDEVREEKGNPFNQ